MGIQWVYPMGTHWISQENKINKNSSTFILCNTLVPRNNRPSTSTLVGLLFWERPNLGHYLTTLETPFTLKE